MVAYLLYAAAALVLGVLTSTSPCRMIAGWIFVLLGVGVLLAEVRL